MSIIFIHELGHFLAAKCCGWKTDKICIYPLGGVTKFNESLNKLLFQELFIVIMGPIFQIIYVFILEYFEIDNVHTFNLLLLLFNLLPIYPLDGGRILNIFFSFFVPYIVSFNVTFIFSYIFYCIGFILFIIYFKFYFFIFVFLSLLFKIIEEKRNIKYYYNKFLLERYFGSYHFKKITCIDNVFDFYRNRSHYFYKDGVIISEKTFLKDYFK